MELTDLELNAQIHARLFQKPVFTQAEMAEAASIVRRRQPDCILFGPGTRIPSGKWVGDFQSWGRPDEGIFRQKIPAYSADLNAAFRVLAEFNRWHLSCASGSYICDLTREQPLPYLYAEAIASSAPRAIALAALAALDAIKESQ